MVTEGTNTMMQQTERQTILTAVSALIDDILRDRTKNSEYIAGAMRVLEEVEHLCSEKQEILPLGKLIVPPF